MSHHLIPSFEVFKLLPASLPKEVQPLPASVVDSVKDNSAPESHSTHSPICSDEVWLNKLLQWVETTRRPESNQPNETRH